MRLKYNNAAQRNLSEIYRFIVDQGADRKIARAFIGQLRWQCQKLAKLPGAMGRARPELRAEMRSFAYRGYIIFFRYYGDVLEVLNIIEGHRDFDARFK